MEEEVSNLSQSPSGNSMDSSYFDHDGIRSWRMKGSKLSYFPRKTSWLSILESSLSEILSAYIEPIIKQWLKNIHLAAILILALFQKFIHKNEVEVPRQICGKTLEESVRSQLAKGQETELIHGLISKSGKPFDAYLKLGEDGKVAFRFPDTRVPSIKSTLPQEILGIPLSQEIQDCLKRGEETPLMKGFTSKHGKIFDAYLKIDPENGIKFRFPDRKNTESILQNNPSRNPSEIKRSTSEPFHQETVPEKTVPAETKRPKIMEEWYPKNNPKIMLPVSLLPPSLFGKDLDSSTLQDLSEGKETKLLEGFSTPSGKTFAAYLQIINKNELHIRIPSKEKDLKIHAIPKIILGVCLSEQNKKSLRLGHETELIAGFKDSNGHHFEASLRKERGGNLILRSKPFEKIIPLPSLGI